mmetsp:Transcript_43881/g.124222  ORF Transcript_43881/g.124222 Transcript_43881/m.124222 type:complete len:273 (+) Transcript_43881:40-858(+)
MYRRAAKWGACGVAGCSAAGLAQVAHLRLHYISPLEPQGHRFGHAGQAFDGKPIRLLFIGDSICMGVGATRAAPLQAACAERFASLRQVPVTWNTIGATGADVQELSALVDVDQAGDDDARRTKGFDIAVVFCGVNDGKKLFMGRFPSVFGRDLRDLCAKLRDKAPEARIAVPCIPAYVAAPLLQLWPMRHLVRFFFGCFEAEKKALEEEDLIQCPSPAEHRMPTPEDTVLWAVDGIHPSGEGYRLVGEWLGTELASPVERTGSLRPAPFCP